MDVKVPKPDVYNVVVPPGMKPGREFKMMTESGEMMIKVPPGVKPGQTMEVKVPKPTSPTPAAAPGQMINVDVPKPDMFPMQPVSAPPVELPPGMTPGATPVAAPAPEPWPG